AKRRQWREFNHSIEILNRAGKTSLQRLEPNQLTEVMEQYRNLACDLARARSMGQSSAIVRHLNGMAVLAHNFLYGHVLNISPAARLPWVQRFPIAVRCHMTAVGLSALLLFGSAAISYVAVQTHPELAYDLVSGGFLDFQPARQDSLHEF